MELTTYIFHLKYWKIQQCNIKCKEKSCAVLCEFSFSTGHFVSLALAFPLAQY